jgi:hypothetical protein
MGTHSFRVQNRRRPATRRSRKWFRKSVLLACITALLASSSTARAVTPFADISSTGPLTHVYIGNELGCQVAHAGDVALELFPPSVIPGDCGSFLAVGGALFAPDFANHGGTATANLGSYTPFTPVSQSAVTGSGTAADPFMVITVVDAGTTGLRITETDSYVVGEGAYRTDVALSNTGTAAQDVVLYRAGDCFLQGSDIGFGFVDTVAKSVGCSVNANNTPPGRIEEWLPITGGNNYYQAFFSQVWSQIGSHVAFPDTCRCTDFIDNGAGISWSFSVPAGGTVTKSHFTVFSPLGISVSIDDVTVTEGNSGTVNATFTVSLNRPVPAGATATVDFATADGTATAPADYTATSGTLTFAPGETSKTATVGVNGDAVCELDETFSVNLSNATGATIADGQGQGTIVNDDPCVPSLSVNDVTVAEGNSGVTNATFTVSLSQTTVNTVTVDFTTADGTATAPADYAATSGALTFAPGETSKTATVGVNGDTLVEADETFFVNLSNAVGATIADGQGQGTIVNDDVGRPLLDHFKCYALSEDEDDDDEEAGPRVMLRDQFGSGEALVGAAVELCNPVSKDGGTINQGNAHLVKYEAKPVRRTFSKRRVEVTNQFGTQVLTVRKPAILAVPSSKSTSGPPGDPPTMLDHFQCYRFVEDDDDDDDDDDGGAFTPRTVLLKDQFKEERVRVRGPAALCNPVEKTHAGQVSPIGSPDEHLVCYAIRAARFAGNVNVRNQFGDATAHVRSPVSLCVPSQKRELPPPLPDDDD